MSASKQLNLITKPGQSSERRKHEVSSTAKQRRRIVKRQSIGDAWDGKADEVKLSWPLATALIREGNSELLKAAMYYRKIEAQANSSPVLGGSDGGSSALMADGILNADRHMYIRSNGEVAYGGVRESTSSLSKTNSGTQVRKVESKISADDIKAPVKTAYKGDSAVNAALDARREYDRLYALLGPIVDPFEDMVCGDMTYLEAGAKMGVGNESGARGASQAVVHMGLIAVRDSSVINKSDVEGAL